MKKYIISFGITLAGNWEGDQLRNLWVALFEIIGYQDLKLWLHGQEVIFVDDNNYTCGDGYDTC